MCALLLLGETSSGLCYMKQKEVNIIKSVCAHCCFFWKTSSGLFYMKQKEVYTIKSVCVCVRVVVVDFWGETSSGLFYMEPKEVNIIKSVYVCAFLFLGGNLLWFVLYETKRGKHY